MNIAAFEGIVEKGRIQLKRGIYLPDKTKVYVLVPELQARNLAHVVSPRLVHPEQAEDFKMEIVEDASDACL